jgi:hypothetical protein
VNKKTAALQAEVSEVPQPDKDRPVFVLAGGRRTGSTLIQRLLISSGEVMIWGEHDGIVLRHLFNLLRGMQGWYRSGAGAQKQFVKFRRQGYNAWIPNMNPPFGHFNNACRAFLDQALGEPARAMSYPRWGFKEVLYGAGGAQFLQNLYPGASFILVIRDPESCLRSIKGTAWGDRRVLKDGPLPFMESWAKLSEELFKIAPKLKNATVIRYEDVLTDTAPTIRKLAAVTGIPVDKFKVTDVLAHRDGGPGGEVREFDEADRKALKHAAVRRVAKLLGY